VTFSARDRWYFVARAVVSASLLAASLFVILSGAFPDPIVKWAIGIVGLVAGYWLR